MSSPLRPLRVLALLVPALIVLTAPSPAVGSEADLVIEGRGWGHGVGMAQDGALAMGRAGADASRILDHFYPGTTDASAGGNLRVVLSPGAGPRAILSFPGGGEIRAPGPAPQPPGFPVSVAASTAVTVSIDRDRTVVSVAAPQPSVRPASQRRGVAPVVVTASFATGAEPPSPSPPEPTTTTTVAAPPTVPSTRISPPITSPTTAPPRGVPPPSPPSRPAPPSPPAPPAAPPPVVGPSDPTVTGPVVAVPAPGGTTLLTDRNRSYRGTIEIGGGGGQARIVNEVDVEDYLRGMGEVRDPSWPAAALQAQAVAARTYALRAMASAGEICADDRCQVYLGVELEYREMDDAVRASRSRVRHAGGTLASTFYSANAGGISATPEEGFGPGGSDLPYLRSVPYQTTDPDPWTVHVSADDASRRLGYPGRLSAARVGRAGPSGRALDVILEGDAGPVTVSGRDFAARLRLRSTLFELSSGRSEEISALPGFAIPGPDDASAPGARATSAQADPPRGSMKAAVMVVFVVVGSATLLFRRWRGATRRMPLTDARTTGKTGTG